MELAEPLMDCNFPELLAGDLGRSEDVFRSKNLTAGPPEASLAGTGRRRRSSTLRNKSLTLTKTTSPQRQRQHKLDPISTSSLMEQPVVQGQGRGSGRYSDVLVPVQQQGSRKSSDSTSTDSSGGMEPPSIAGRDVSVFTAATSVTSGRLSPSDKSNSPSAKSSSRSWVDLEFEDSLPQPSFHLDRCYSLGGFQPPPPLQSPQDYSHDSRSMSMGGGKTAGKGGPVPFSAFNSSPSKAISFPKHARVSQTFEANRIMQPAEVPARRSSLGHSKDLLQLPHLRNVPRSPPSPNLFVTSGTSHPAPQSSLTRSSTSAGRASPHQRDDEVRSMLSLDDDDDDEEESDAMIDRCIVTPKEKHQIATPTIISPLSDVEQWVDQSSIEFSHLPQLTKDRQGSRMHITPEVLDTLRISVACFPETLLLCSSLSIETLRGNAKKVRYRAADLHNASQLAMDLPDLPKPSKWNWLTTKRTPEPSPTKLHFRPGGVLQSLEETVDTRCEPAEWQALKNIFPNGTDHLCDALYAHILAYNCISSMCPRSSVVSQTARPVSKQSNHPSLSDHSSGWSDGHKIPMKAASLLGLQNDHSVTIPTSRDRDNASTTRLQTLRGKASILGGKREHTKTFGSTANRSADDHDESLKDLRLGLAKCIARLVGTLRLTSSEELGQSTKPMDIKDIDPLFIRALCEVVRCNEEQ